MGDLNIIFLVLAVICAAVGVGLMIAMTSAVQARGEKVNWVLLRLFVLNYIHEYRIVTIKETGRAGPLFYPFVISMNLALVFAILGIVL